MKLTVSCCPWITFTTPSGQPGKFFQSRELKLTFAFGTFPHLPPSTARQGPCRLWDPFRWAAKTYLNIAFFSYLHYVCVAANESHWEHPEGDHGRKIEGGNASADSQRGPGWLNHFDPPTHLWQVRSMSLLTPTKFSPINRLVTLHACSTTLSSLFLVSIEHLQSESSIKMWTM